MTSSFVNPFNFAAGSSNVASQQSWIAGPAAAAAGGTAAAAADVGKLSLPGSDVGIAQFPPGGFGSFRRGRFSLRLTMQGKIYNFLERPTGWKCFMYHFTV